MSSETLEQVVFQIEDSELGQIHGIVEDVADLVVVQLEVQQAHHAPEAVERHCPELVVAEVQEAQVGCCDPEHEAVEGGHVVVAEQQLPGGSVQGEPGQRPLSAGGAVSDVGAGVKGAAQGTAQHSQH